MGTAVKTPKETTMPGESKRPARSSKRMMDIAKAAGVSLVTVSRVLNHPGQVSPRTRERVQSAIASANYVPDLVAGSLASRRSKIIGVIIPTITNSLFADTIQGLTDVVEKADYKLVIGSSRYDLDAEANLARAFLSRRADALILTGVTHNETTLKLLTNADIPIFEMWALTDNPIDMVVGFSNFETASSMTRFLYEKGYRNIGFMGGLTENNDRTMMREKGYLAALHDLGLPVLPERIERTVFDFHSGAQALKQLLARCPELDAIFAASDVLAVGAVFECHRQGWSVPDRIAIAGLDDSIIAAELVPPLTTIRIPRYDIGVRIGEEILSRLNGTPRGQRQIDLGFTIIERAST